MVILRYSRLGTRRFVSHIDVLRDFARIVRRADIPVAYSGGFNPHALLFFAPPTPVGIGSVAEYVAIDTPLSPEEVMAAFDSAVTEEMRATEAFSTTRNPNLAGRICAAEYVFPFAADAYDFSRGLTLDYMKKGERVTESAGDRILSVGEREGRLLLTLACGNVTLRADRVFDALKRELAAAADISDVMKTEQFIRADAGLLAVKAALTAENAAQVGK